MGIIFELWVHQNRCAGAHVNPSWISCPDCLMHGIHGVWSCVTNRQIDGCSCSGMNAPLARSIIHWIALDLIINESNAFNGKMIQSCLIPLTMLMWNPKIKRERRYDPTFLCDTSHLVSICFIARRRHIYSGPDKSAKSPMKENGLRKSFDLTSRPLRKLKVGMRRKMLRTVLLDFLIPLKLYSLARLHFIL